MDSMEKVLNHLGNTAVYIIRADNHQILYCNDRVKAVTPSAQMCIRDRNESGDQEV